MLLQDHLTMSPCHVIQQEMILKTAKFSVPAEMRQSTKQPVNWHLRLKHAWRLLGTLTTYRTIKVSCSVTATVSYFTKATRARLQLGNRAFCVAGPEQSPTGHSFGTYIINVQKHAQDTSFLTFLIHWLTVSRVWAANIVQRPCSDSSHVTAPSKLSFYYHYYLSKIPMVAQKLKKQIQNCLLYSGRSSPLKQN